MGRPASSSTESTKRSPRSKTCVGSAEWPCAADSRSGFPSSVAPGRWAEFVADLLARLAVYHVDNPDRQGIGREQLRLASQPRLPRPAFGTALQRLAYSDKVSLDGAFVRLPSQEVRLAPADASAWETFAPRLGGEQRFRPPRVRDLVGETGRPEPEVRRVLKLASRVGRADEVAHDHFFLRPTISEMAAIAAELSKAAADGWFTAAEFRDRLDNGRKFAIQILDFVDRCGLTLRRGDLRRINRHRLDLFGADANGRESSPVGRPDFKSVWGSEPVPGGFDSHSLPPVSKRAG